MGRNERSDIIPTTNGSLAAAKLLKLVQSVLDDDKALDIVVIDLSGKTSFGDYMVIASGNSQRQVGAMAEHLRENLKHAGIRDLAVEGASQCDWVLIDAGDVIVHLFRPEVRDFYNLEKIWKSPAPSPQVEVHA